jgi:hypothetical protein
MTEETTTKFSFIAFRNLKKGLGDFDAVVECNELAIREFINNISTSSKPEKYISDLAIKHKVTVNTVSVPFFSARIRQFYILSVLQQAEQFIDEFKKEYKMYFTSWDEKIYGETDLDNLLRNAFPSKENGVLNISKEVYDAFEYYRLVRNRFAHSEEKDLKRLENQRQLLNDYKEFYKINFNISGCPNTYTEINFDDFILCTNIVKSIGYTLCEKCKPDNSKIAERIVKLEIIQDNNAICPIKSIWKHKNDNDRFLNALDNLLNSNFGKIGEIDRNEILENINRILA